MTFVALERLRLPRNCTGAPSLLSPAPTTVPSLSREWRSQFWFPREPRLRVREFRCLHAHELRRGAISVSRMRHMPGGSGPCAASNHPWFRKFLNRLQAIEFRFPRTTTRWSRDSSQSEHPDRLEGCKLTQDRLPPLF